MSALSPQPEASGNRTIILASPHGFCAGVERAVAMAESLLERHPHPVYCLRQIVHNRQVIDALTAQGMVFVQDINEVPRGATVLFSAHGISPGTRDAARQRELHTIDATCPFVTKVHNEVRRYGGQGYSVLLVGDRHHDEIVGVASEAPDQVTIIENAAEAEAVTVPDPDKVAVMTQTTLSLDELSNILTILRLRFPALKMPSEMDICYATRNRQQAVRQLAARVDAFVILGAENSSNSNRLVAVAQSEGCPAYLASSIEKLAGTALDNVNRLGLTAGASTPESFVREAVAHLLTRGFGRVEEFTAVKEDMHFTLPRE
jgi:4-hydroxy-3-methylbut-2-enyl diphosphate reductase